jgi:hypothetical protein
MPASTAPLVLCRNHPPGENSTYYSQAGADEADQAQSGHECVGNRRSDRFHCGWIEIIWHCESHKSGFVRLNLLKLAG